jgi:GDPmannose 4,6-dehydratase
MQWMMLQQDNPQDFVIATGVQHSVRHFVQSTAKELGVTLIFEGQGVDEVGRVASIEGADAPALKVGQVVVRVDPRYFRPAEVESLLGDPSKAKKELGWVPEISLDQMIKEMVAKDLSIAKQHSLLKQHGFDVSVGIEH